MRTKRKPSAFLPRSVQVADYLKELFRSGHLGEELPAERALAAQIGVSRDTLRSALALLNDEGWVLPRTRPGTRARMVRQPLTRRRMTVGLLVLMKMAHTTYRTLMWVDEVRRLLYQKEVDVEVYDGYNHRRNFFQRIDREASHDAWLLIYPNLKALRWMTQTQAPCVVAGTLDAAYGVPYVDLHYRALCRHAAGRLTQLGHRHLVYIIQKREWGADQESIAGFQEGAAGKEGVTVSIEHHDGTRAGICALTDRLLARTPRPTAWMIGVAPHFMTIQMHLLKRGIPIPGEISLVSQDSEPWQSFSTPEPARYMADFEVLAKHTVRLLLKSLSGKPSAPVSRLVIPELHPAQTLGPAPLSAP